MDLDGARFADLYAGSGAVGLEALSRGAAHVLLVESDPRAARVIRENIAALRRRRRPPGWSPARWPPCSPAGPDGGPYDVVFADPPYAVPDEEIAAVLAGAGRRRLAGRRTPWWWSSGPPAAGPLELGGRASPRERSRRYGETTLWYGRRS